MKKKDRLELIRKIVQENKITTQKELVRLLQAEGLKATQATVSRDINEIGITKVPTEDGSYIYGLSTAPRRVGRSSVACRRLLRIDRQHAFMNILVQPGTSRLIKKILLDEYKQLSNYMDKSSSGLKNRRKHASRNYDKEFRNY